MNFAHECNDAVEAGETAVGCLADLWKAFDCFGHIIFWKPIGISGLLFKWIASRIKNRYQITDIKKNVNPNF